MYAASGIFCFQTGSFVAIIVAKRAKPMLKIINGTACHTVGE
jgi:hypothetical protein